MGKVIFGETTLTFTKLQKVIFEEFSKDHKLKKTFYFTGGTALSAIYLHHRESEDLDFFADQGFDNLIVDQFIDKIALERKLTVRFTEVFSTRIFNLVDSLGSPLIKIDFNYYPYPRIEKGEKIFGIEIDSPKDIAINKLMAINERTEVKDYVDLYFLLQKFELKSLIKGVKIKFRREIDLIMLASDFLKAEVFEILPKMLVPFKMFDLKFFFTEKAKELGKGIVLEKNN